MLNADSADCADSGYQADHAEHPDCAELLVLTAVHIFPNHSMKFSRLVYLQYGVKIDLYQFQMER